MTTQCRPPRRFATYCLLPLCLILALVLFAHKPVSSESLAADKRPIPNPQPPAILPLPAQSEVRIFEHGLSSPQVACTLQWQGPTVFRALNSLEGGYRVAAHQDPGAEGCPGPFPFGVTDIWWSVYFAVDVPIQVQLMIYGYPDTASCPVPSDTIFAGPVYTINVPAAGPWYIRMSLIDTVCVNRPFFAGIRLLGGFAAGIVDIMMDSNAPQACRTYRDTASGWRDLVVADGFTHNMGLWSAGLDQSQNGCPIANQCPINVAVAPNPVNAVVGSQAGATITASDPDGGGPLQYFLVSGPGSVNISSGAWTYAPTCVDVPGFTVIVEASDRGAGGCPQSQASFQVNVAPPVLSIVNCTSVNVHWGDTASHQLNSAGGCPPVTFTKLSGLGSVTSGGYWSYQTDCGDIGDDFVKIRATDVGGQTADCEFGFGVTNISPTCQSPVAASAPPGELTQVLLGPATDLDGDALLYILVSGPVWGGINGMNWTATRPLADTADYTVCYTVGDGCRTSTQCCFLVTESCQCECHADPQCDGATDILDVVLTVNCAFRGAPTIPFCSTYPEVGGRTDVDCTGATDILDVVKMIDVAFRGADPATKFCEPCQP